MKVAREDFIYLRDASYWKSAATPLNTLPGSRELHEIEYRELLREAAPVGSGLNFLRCRRFDVHDLVVNLEDFFGFFKEASDFFGAVFVGFDDVIKFG